MFNILVPVFQRPAKKLTPLPRPDKKLCSISVVSFVGHLTGTGAAKSCACSGWGRAAGGGPRVPHANRADLGQRHAAPCCNTATLVLFTKTSQNKATILEVDNQ